MHTHSGSGVGHDFTVVIPAFNSERTIVESIRSALGQPHVREVIVVDDGSVDATAELAQSTTIANGLPTILRQRHVGPGAARNLGAFTADSTYLVFLDADDQLLPGALSMFRLGHMTGAKLVRSGAVIIDEHGIETVEMAVPSPHPFPRGCPLAGSFSIERELFSKLGGYDPAFRYGENSELIMRISYDLSSYRCVPYFVDSPTVRVVRQQDRPSGFYRSRQLAAIDLMLDHHSSLLDADSATRRDHHGIASNLHRQEGHYLLSVRHAASALALCPTSARGWLRLLRTAVPARRSR